MEQNGYYPIQEPNHPQAQAFDNYVAPALYFIIATIGIFGNLLIIILLMKRGLKSAVDILIINLSAADCLYCLGLPIWANDLIQMRKWSLGVAACKLFSAISLLNLYGSVYFLSFMSIDRYIAVCHPIRARRIRTKTYGWVLAAIAWLFSLGLSSQALVFRMDLPYMYNSTWVCEIGNGTDERCPAILAKGEIVDKYRRCVWNFKNVSESEIFLLGRMTTGFVVPIVIILASYSFILCRTSKMQQSRNCNRNRRVNKMIACVIASFLVSWTPNHCLTFSIYLIGKNQMPKWMYYWNSVTQVFANASAMANPIIYAFTRDDLRQVANLMFRSCLDRFKSDKFETFAQNTVVHYVSPKAEKKSNGTLNNGNADNLVMNNGYSAQQWSSPAEAAKIDNAIK